MTNHFHHRWLTGLLLLVLAAPAPAQTPVRAVNVPEPALRQMVVTRVMPEYPAASVARGAQGVVVARVRAGLDNRIERVDVVQSPDANIADAVRAALAQWTVNRRGETGGPVGNAAESRLTFYFQIRNGKGIVLNPDEMPGNEQVFTPRDRPAARAGGAPATMPMQDMAGVEEIDEAALQRLLSNATTVLLDLRDREPFASSARPRAINIPVEELTVRAGAEMSRDAQIVIDCSQDQTFRCRAGDHMLRQAGFGKVAIFLP